MEPAWFDRVLAEHQEILAAVDRLSGAVGDPEALGAALDAFLLFQRDHIEPLLREEEARLGPLLDRYLPPEVGCSATFRDEHDTVRELVEALRMGRRRLGVDPDALGEIESVVSDLSLLVHDHIRREDSVVNPLLRRLDEVGRG